MHLTNLFKLMINESVQRWAKQVHSQYVNGVSSPMLSFGKSAVFCCWSLSLNCLHLTHFKMIHEKVKSCHLKNKRALFGSLSSFNQHGLLAHDPCALSTLQFCRILASTMDVAFHLPEVIFESFPQLLIFLHCQWMDLSTCI